MVPNTGSVSPTKQGIHEAKGAQSFSFFCKSSTDQGCSWSCLFSVEELTENMAGEPITFCQLS